MTSQADRAVAIVGVGAVLPDAPNVAAFWANLAAGRDSISDVPADRWDVSRYYDPDPRAVDKTYSRIGGWVKAFDWDPLAWRLPIPPRVAAVMDLAQRWAIVSAREALADYGYPGRPLDGERTAVIMGNALGGDFHLLTAMRVLFPEIAAELEAGRSFQSLPEPVRQAVIEELRAGVRSTISDITEDTMPGELANIVAGRVANVFDFKGPNYITDAACASTMAAVNAAVEGLVGRDFDAVLTGGVDANMSPSTFVKFCKIGALSATGSRPYAEGADGFVMGEGAACFVLKRLDDAERAGDRVYAVIRGLGGSSDGRGKGITAPNPAGQRLAVRRAWDQAGVRPEGGDMMEGHGTSTKVGDVVEVESLADVFRERAVPAQSVLLGSVKSNFGHLKAAAGAAGILKATLALHHKQVPPSLHFTAPNPSIDFARSPFRVPTTMEAWEKRGSNGDTVRRAGVSAFGFGGTNFHAVLEEYVPGRLGRERTRVASAALDTPSTTSASSASAGLKAPLRGALVLGGGSHGEIANRLAAIKADADQGRAPRPLAPAARDLAAPVRLAIDYGSPAELADLAGKALEALKDENEGRWRALRNKGVFLGRGTPGKVAFLFTGQGSQYVNMLAELRATEPLVAATFAEADRAMAPLLGRPLTECIYVDAAREDLVAQATEGLRQTSITQPAILTVDTALARLLAAYGIEPDMVMGHSLGEYGALVAAGALPFADALVAVAARGKAMTALSLGDCGQMAAVFGPVGHVESLLKRVNGYVVIANINSGKECVIGGATDAVQAATTMLQGEGLRVTQLPVSHAFHTRIVEPAAAPLMEVMHTLGVRPPRIPVISNVTGEFYPMGTGVEEQLIGLLGRQIGSPVQFVKGLGSLYDAGARVFVEAGPKRVLFGLADDVLGGKPGFAGYFTNQPRTGDIASFNRALCGLYAEGLGKGAADDVPVVAAAAPPAAVRAPEPVPAPAAPRAAGAEPSDRIMALGRMFAEFLEKSASLYAGGESQPPVRFGITGASLGIPGTPRVFDDTNVARLLAGEVFIKPVPDAHRQGMVARKVTRLVKGAGGEAEFASIEDTRDVVRLAGIGGTLDLSAEYGYPADRVQALDRVTRLAIAAGIDALRDAGIPLVPRYRTTTTGTQLRTGWMLPEDMRDDTAIIFGSAFPGLDSLAGIIEAYDTDRNRRERRAELETVRSALGPNDQAAAAAIGRRIDALTREIEAHPFAFDRRFLFQVLAMGHSQFAEYIGARGPNVQTNGACSTGTQAIGFATDWIARGRCRRVIIVTADDITTDTLLPWFGSGFLASGAVATDERVEDAALPFDKRRHGLIIGMGGAALVVENLESAAERGIAPICEVLGTVVANSAYHGSRLDTGHVASVMETLVSDVERRWGLDRHALAADAVFVSHETYTPARGGSASAEVEALRRVFGGSASSIVIANTKGFTGHPMATGIEDTLAVKMLETGIVPPVPHIRELDPDLGVLNLSRGGAYPVRYALRLAAGFGSQISMALLRWSPPPDGQRRAPTDLGYQHRIADRARWQAWLERATGQSAPELEVVARTLRAKDKGAPVEAPRPAAPPPAPVPVAVPAPAGDAVRNEVLAIVAAQTGYPPDMLAMDLDLEADLGIDTVKQAEMFAAIRQKYGIERDETLALRDYATLARAVEFVYEKRPDLRPSAIAPAAAAAPASTVSAPVTPAAAPAMARPAAASSDAVREKVLAIVAQQTGYPPDMLALDLDLEADLGIDTVKQAEMFAAIRQEYGIERDETIALRDYPTLARAIEFVYEKRPDLKPSARAAMPPSTASAPAPLATPAVANVPAATGGGADGVREQVLAIVAQQTGYPPDMLALDLDLEADLGIDTVKQAEMFAAIRQVYGIERDETIALRDYPTLARAIEFVYEKRPDLKPGAAAASPTAAATPASSASHPGAATAAAAAAGSDAAAQAVPRRVPVAFLRPAAAQFVSTGVALGAGDRVIVAKDSGGVADALIRRLEERGVRVLLLDDCGNPDDVEKRASAWMAKGAISGVYWLPALDLVGDEELLDTGARATRLNERVRSLYRLMRTLYEVPAFLVSATRLGGRHGYGEDGAADVIGGAVVGFTKAFAREQPDRLVKAVDFAPSRKTAAIADQLIDETLHDPGVVEAGYADGRRWTVGLVERPTEFGAALPGKDGVFVVTGAAGSITSAIVADLAAATKATFWLLDLTPEPDPSNPDLARLDTDRDGLKRDLLERLKASGQRATPALVDQELGRLERAKAALAAIRAVESSGGRARYRAVDLRSADQVAAVMAEVVREHGKVDVLVHAAGLEISKPLPRKDPREFDLVFDVKVQGWFNLVAGLGQAPLGAAVVFSSIAGRFGNAGQTDYASANDLLCKAMASLRRTRPATRGIAIDWTAWGDIGMATRGSIPTIMKQAGIDMLPSAAGIPIVRRELSSGTNGEVLIAGALGVMLSEPKARRALEAAPAAVMVGSVESFGPYGGLIVQTPLDPSVQPFLGDHRIDGTAVLPGVMGIEAMCAAALAGFPDRFVAGLEDVAFQAPFKFYRGEPRTVAVRVQYTTDGDDVLAHCRVEGSRQLFGREEAELTTHFSGVVRLSAQAPAGAKRRPLPDAPAESVAGDSIYGVFFHGPAYQVLGAAWRANGTLAGRLAAGLPPNHQPADTHTFTAPRLIELGFQTAGLAEIAQTARMGLPSRIDRLTFVRAPAGEPGGSTALVKPAGEGAFDIDVTDCTGHVLLAIRGYRTSPLGAVPAGTFASLKE